SMSLGCVRCPPQRDASPPRQAARHLRRQHEGRYDKRLRTEQGVLIMLTHGRPQRRLTSVLGVITIAFLIASCGGNAVQVERPSEATASPTGEYLIGPGDTLEIFVWRQPELSATVPVRPDGKISTPLVEDLVAVGKTPTQLAREMEEVLSEYIRSPEVNVIVQSFVGTFAEQIRVLGQAAQPRAIPYRERMTLLD